MKCKPYSEITVEIRTQLKTVKITSNIFAVHRKNSNSSTTATTVTKTREEMESWGSQETPWGENISEVI